jgi:DNA-binding GntR family transcriptional regulator
LILSSHIVKRNQSLQEQVYQAIRTAILSGEFVPGERLFETKLSKKLQVSRTPIREALRQLQQQDLVICGENNVLRVVEFSIQDAIQLYDCRLALEKLSVTEACEQINRNQLQTLEQMLSQSEKLSKTSSSQLTDFQMLDLDYRFHRLLAESSGNLWLRSLLDQVFDKMTIIRVHTLQQNRQVLNIDSEHQKIYDSLVEGNADKAIIAITKHLNTAKNRVIQEMEKMKKYPKYSS